MDILYVQKDLNTIANHEPFNSYPRVVREWKMRHKENASEITERQNCNMRATAKVMQCLFEALRHRL